MSAEGVGRRRRVRPTTPPPTTSANIWTGWAPTVGSVAPRALWCTTEVPLALTLNVIKFSDQQFLCLTAGTKIFVEPVTKQSSLISLATCSNRRPISTATPKLWGQPLLVIRARPLQTQTPSTALPDAPSGREVNHPIKMGSFTHNQQLVVLLSC